MIKKRRPALAALLSLPTPGLGHVYAGDIGKGFSIVGILYALLLIAGALGIFSTSYGVLLMLAIIIGFFLFSIISSVRLALRNKEYKLKSYNRWYWYLIVAVLYLVLMEATFSNRGKLLGYETYSIPSQSMSPTLQVGDYITVDTRYSQPKVGDVIVFKYPVDRSVSFVKRAAALGNDTIAIKNGKVFRNGKHEESLLIPESQRQRPDSTSVETIRVPAGEIFVLGDSRDNSADSRYWGTFPATDVIGKVTYIWFSTNPGRMGKAVSPEEKSD